MSRSEREALRGHVEAELLAAGKSGVEQCRIACPSCVSSKTGRADQSMSVKNGRFKCHRCGLWGYLDGARALPVALPADYMAPVALPGGFCELSEEPWRSAMVTEPARAYLAARGVPEALVAAWGAGVVLDGYHAGRVVVPVRVGGVSVGWVARDYTGLAERKYLYPRGMHRGKWLFNHAALSAKTRVPLIVVEGFFDTAAFWPHAAAVLGQPSEEHMRALGECQRPVLFCMDGDAWEAGQAMAWRLQLDGVDARSVRLPPKLDPDQCVGLVREAVRSW